MNFPISHSHQNLEKEELNSVLSFNHILFVRRLESFFISHGLIFFKFQVDLISLAYLTGLLWGCPTVWGEETIWECSQIETPNTRETRWRSCYPWVIPNPKIEACGLESQFFNSLFRHLETQKQIHCKKYHSTYPHPQKIGNWWKRNDMDLANQIDIDPKWAQNSLACCFFLKFWSVLLFWF